MQKYGRSVCTDSINQKLSIKRLQSEVNMLRKKIARSKVILENKQQSKVSRQKFKNSSVQTGKIAKKRLTRVTHVVKE